VLKEIEPGRAVFEMEAGERHHNPMGTLHGGIYCDLADAELPTEVYADVRAAREEIRAYLRYYDTKRRHSSLNYLTPCEFELCQE
jgi:transposase InsO family protein